MVRNSKRLIVLIVFFLVIGCYLGWNLIPTEKEPEQNVLKQGGVYTRPETISSPAEAMLLLKVGNERFAAGRVLGKDMGRERRAYLFDFGQHPFAVIVSCSDSRVPPELVFDQALGDLFVVRVAGNVMNAIEIGSVEYAVEHLHAPLIIVMGHEQCGAIKAAVDNVEVSENIQVIVDKIKPAIDLVKAGENDKGSQNLYEAVTDVNVMEVVRVLNANHIVKEAIAEHKLLLVGAKYHLESGQVTYFTDGPR